MTDVKPERIEAWQTAGLLTMVLVHADGHVGIGLDGGFDQLAQEGFAGVLARRPQRPA